MGTVGFSKGHILQESKKREGYMMHLHKRKTVTGRRIIQ
jgi:hypothetical protein